MNDTFLRNLSDSEFLKHIDPKTDLERMLVARLEEPDSEPSEIEIYRQEAHEAELLLEGAQDELDSLREYANKLHAALENAEPENELLDSDDSELLTP